MAGQQNGALGAVRAHLVPEVVRRGIRQQRVGVHQAALVAQRLGGDFRRLQGAPVRAGKDQRGRHLGLPRAFEHPPQFVAAFGREGALGIGPARGGIFGNGVTQEIDLHPVISSL